MSDRYGPDGLGPEPSPEVAKIRDAFFDDEKPPPHDPEVAKRAGESIEKRKPAWWKHRRDL